MTCLTRRASTAYCSTDRQLRSVWTTTCATFRWTNSSPGGRSTISFAGTRLSEQPIHRYAGACCATRREKNSGFWRARAAAQRRLLSKRSDNLRKRDRPRVPGRRAGLLGARNLTPSVSGRVDLRRELRTAGPDGGVGFLFARLEPGRQIERNVH